MSYLEEVLTQAAETELANLNEKITEINERVSQLKLEAKEMMEDKYITLNFMSQDPHELRTLVQRLGVEMDCLMKHINSQTMQQLCNSTGEVQKLLASLKEVALKYQYVTQLLSIDMQLNEAGKAYEEKRYVDTACSLKELLGLLKTVSKTESPEIFKALSTERVYVFERFMYDMTEAWGSCLSIEETDLADGGKLARLIVHTDRKEELGQVFQALDSFDHVDFVLGKFSTALMSRILEPVVRNRSHAQQATEENVATLEVKMLPGTTPPKYNDVMQSLTTVFRFLSAHLNMVVGAEATLLSRVGEVVGEEFCASLVEHCVSHLVPGQQQSREREVELVLQVREVLVGLQTQLKLSRFLSKSNNMLTELATNIDQLCAGRQCQQLLDRARTIMKKDLHDMVRIGPQPPKKIPPRKKNQSPAKSQNESPPTKEQQMKEQQTKTASAKNRNKNSSPKLAKDDSSTPVQNAVCPTKCEGKTKCHADTPLAKVQGEVCTMKQDRDVSTPPITELKASVVNVEMEASVKDGNLFKLLGYTKPDVEQTLDTFQQPECQISKSTEELMILVTNILDQASHNTGQYAVRLFITTRNIFELYMAVVPVHHRKFLETIPQHVALFHNNCMYLAHRLITLGLECQRSFSEEVLRENTVTFVDLAQKLRHIGAEQFLAQMKAQRDNILEILRSSGLSTLGDNPHLSPQTEKSVRQCLRQFEFLGSVWRGVLPRNVYDKSLGCLVNSFLGDIVVHVVKAEDIPAETAVELANVFELVQNRVPTVFTDKSDLRKHVKLWTKFGELVLVLQGTLREIEDRWGAGSGPTAQVFTPNELKQLVRALFQNTERRAALLAKIK